MQNNLIVAEQIASISLEDNQDLETVMLLPDVLETPATVSEMDEFWNTFKASSAQALPMIASFTFSFEVFLTNLLLISLSENDEEVAAIALISMLMNFLCVVGMSPIFSVSVAASNKVGELMLAETEGENEAVLVEKCEHIAGISRNGMYLSLLVTPPVVGCMLFAKPILTGVFGQDAQVAQYVQTFFNAYAPGVPGLMLRIASEQMLFSFGKAKQVMMMALSSLCIGTGAAVWMGFGGLGVPRLGATGVAAGFALEAWLTALGLSVYLSQHPDFSRFEFFHLLKSVKGQGKQFLELLKITASIAPAIISEMTMSLSMGILSGLIGVIPQSAMTYINQYLSFNLLFSYGFGISCSQEMNRRIGAQNYEGASTMGKYGLYTTLIYTAPLPVIFAAAPGLLLVTAKNLDQVKDLLKILTPIMSTGAILDAARYNLGQQLRVMGDLKGSTIVSVGGLALGITTSALLGLKTELGVYGVAIGYTGGIALAGGALYIRWIGRINSQNLRDSFQPPRVDAPPRSWRNRFFELCSRDERANEEQLLPIASTSYGTSE